MIHSCAVETMSDSAESSSEHSSRASSPDPCARFDQVTAGPGKVQPWKAWAAQSDTIKGEDRPWVNWQPKEAQSGEKPWLDWVNRYYDPKDLMKGDPAAQRHPTGAEGG